jgi:hypothetical protein
MAVYLQENKNRLPICTRIILGVGGGTRFLGEHTERCVELVLKSETALGDSPCYGAAEDGGDEIAGVEGREGGKMRRCGDDEEKRLLFYTIPGDAAMRGRCGSGGAGRASWQPVAGASWWEAGKDRKRDAPG